MAGNQTARCTIDSPVKGISQRMSSAVDDSPSARILAKFLLDSVRRGASRIHIERLPKMVSDFASSTEKGRAIAEVETCPAPRESHKRFSVSMEIDGAWEEVEMFPIVLWDKVISRLKVLARMVDYGPEESVDGYLLTPLEDGTQAEFYVTTNPNPFSDNEVTVE